MLQWQQSNNKSTWSDSVGMTKDTFSIKISKSFYYRTRITSGNCNPYYSKITYVQIVEKMPIISTSSIINITSTSSISGGNIISDGNLSIIEQGICWSTTSSPTILDNKIINSANSISFTSNILGLTPSTTYYVRAYATNNLGTAFGEQKSFTTLAQVIILLPTITTNTASNISTNSATVGGVINSNGGTIITESGVCFSLTPSPTITDGKIVNNTSSLSFIYNLSNLTASTTYYVRAYSINSVGTAYGSQISFSTSASSTVATPTTVTDIDGNVYNTVVIGTQVWMKENLKTIHYSNGDVIPRVSNNSSWAALTTGAYCDLNNLSSNGILYGHLYNFYTISDSRNLCPLGWHIPSKEEWLCLDSILGIVNSASKMRTTSNDWKLSNSIATNESGFSALPVEGRSEFGYFSNIVGIQATFWSSTEVSNNMIFKVQLHYNSDIIRGTEYLINKNKGLTIRCLRN